MVYPFLIAMSVKESSMEILASLFPAMNQKPLTYIFPGKSVRFLAPDIGANIQKAVFPVREVIFICYDNTVEFNCVKFDPVKAASLLLAQEWVTSTAGNVALLFERISEMSFYQMTYSDNQKAMDFIANLFDNN